MLVAQAGITKINLILIYIEYVYYYFFLIMAKKVNS